MVAAARVAEIEYFATRMARAGSTLVTVWAPDAAYETGDLDGPGPRHRLVMDPAGWTYERTS